MNERAKEIFQVMIADDSANDRLLFRAAVQRATRLQVVAEAADGAEVLAYLNRHTGHGAGRKAGAPDLLLLDLKMPVMDGFAVLEWLGGRPFDGMTVVAFTNSMDPAHIRRALDSGADFFQVKPQSHKDCVSMVLALEERLVNGLRPKWPWHPGLGAAQQEYKRPRRDAAAVHHGA
jgi:CheY-like chemotaxis protein